jgi:flavin reductase (DIM6/NTAB) family NADH-FMN oxidoreductase RutF
MIWRGERISLMGSADRQDKTGQAMTGHVVSHLDQAFDPRELRNALGRFATGVTVITTRAPDGKLEGITVNSFAAVSLDPPLVLWSIKRGAPSLVSFEAAGLFAINILTQDQADLSHRFATPAPDKFAGLDFSPGLGECPLLAATVATFECGIERLVEGGDHLIVIGRVRRFAYSDAPPLLFSAGRYCLASPLSDHDAEGDLASMWDGLG